MALPDTADFRQVLRQNIREELKGKDNQEKIAVTAGLLFYGGLHAAEALVIAVLQEESVSIDVLTGAINLYTSSGFCPTEAAIHLRAIAFA